MVKLPIDNLANLWPKNLKGAKAGAVLHPASISASLSHSLDILKSYNGKLFELKTLMGPQHGFYGETQDNMIEWDGFEHPELKIPVYSLYGEFRKPTGPMLDGIDVLIVDLQDVGARYYTFIWTLFFCMEACQEQNISVVVLDRPNPIGNTVEGPIQDPNYLSFVGLHPIPVRHGKTIGQLAKQFKAEVFNDCSLTVLEMENWKPGMWYDDTELPWVFPSPNMPTLDTATVYPGMCLLEGTNISEARGTTKPFEVFGAPFIDSMKMVEAMAKLKLPGVHFRPMSFQPTFHKWMNQNCNGAQIHVTDRNTFLPYKTGIEILRWIKNTYPNDFAWKKPPYEYEYEKLPIEILLGGPVSDYF